MTAKEIKVKGLTTKHAAEAVKIASRFASEISIACGNRIVNAKSLMGIIALGLKNPQTIKLTATGEDEQRAVEMLASFFEGAVL